MQVMGHLEPAFRWIDVADEVAFLPADLDSRRQPLHAQAFLAGYVAHSGDYQACRLLKLYEAHRSLVRAKVTALTARAAVAGTSGGTTALHQQYDDYLDCARSALSPKRPILVLMHGLSGSGKSWIAGAPGTRA